MEMVKAAQEMEISRALEFIRKDIEEKIPHFKHLSRENEEFPLWHQKMVDILEAAFGKDSDEYVRFSRVGGLYIYVGYKDESRQAYEDHRHYISNLTQYELVLKSILQRYETLEISGVSTTPATGAPPKVLIAQGGESVALDKLCEFLTALGVKPIVVEKMPSQGRSVDENVDYYLGRADCVVILATKGDIDGKTGDFIPRGNILIEEGRCQERLPGRIVYLLEEGVRYPSNISENVWERFTPINMERAFIKIARELVAFGFLKAMKGD